MPDQSKLFLPSLLLWAAVACWHAGMVRSKNAVSVLLASLAILCVGVLSFVLLGAAFCPARPDRFIDLPTVLGGHAGTGWLQVVPLLVLTLAGTIAERARFYPLFVPVVLLTGLAGPIILQWLSRASSSWQPLQDESLLIFGSLLISASASLTLAALIGPRQGKFNRDGSTTFFPGHSVPLHVLGAIGMVGSLVPPTGAASLASSAAGLLGGLLLGQLRFAKPDPICILTGLVSGAIAGGVVVSLDPRLVPPWLVLALGGLAGFLAPWAALLIELRAKIDDPSMLSKPLAVAVVVPMVLAWLFIPGPLSDVLRRVGGALLVAVILSLAGILAAAIGWGLLRVLGVSMRASEADEYDGLDLATHDINAYPDFQQTMIKSHHMRQA